MWLACGFDHSKQRQFGLVHAIPDRFKQLFRAGACLLNASFVLQKAGFHPRGWHANAAGMKKNRRKKQRGSAAPEAKTSPMPEQPIAAVLEPDASSADQRAERLKAAIGDRLIVFVGMMAAGKTSVGRMVAHHLGISFVDADQEIETAAQMTVPEIFAQRGETEFRSGERRVIARLLRDGPRVLATGGGAYMAPETRMAIRERGIAIWLKVETDTIIRRARKRSNRPLLQTADPEATVRELVRVRYPIYAEADLTIVSDNLTHEQTTELVLNGLEAHLLSTNAQSGAAVNAETAEV
jgi:shikimate kinase